MKIELLPNIGLRIGNTLIVADIHLGSLGIPHPELLNLEVNQYLKALEIPKCKRIVINGDVKEAIGRPRKAEYEAIKKLLEGLEAIFGEVLIVKGNHDGMLEEIIREMGSNSIVIGNLVIDKLLILHGHRWVPLELLASAEYLVTGHIHPTYRLAGTRIRSWLLTDLLLREGGEDIRLKWIVLPALSQYTPGFLMNSLSEQEVAKLLPLKPKEIRVLRIAILSDNLITLEERVLNGDE